MENLNQQSPDRRRKGGFAKMSLEERRKIASIGGKAAHAQGTAHEWTSAEAREAGRKGGVSVSRDRQHMAKIGRSGGGSPRKRMFRMRKCLGCGMPTPRRHDFSSSNEYIHARNKFVREHEAHRFPLR